MAENPYVHLMATALLGKTAEHLRTDHGEDPQPDGPDSKRANAGAHMVAHGYRLTARERRVIRSEHYGN